MAKKVQHGFKLKHNEPFMFYGDKGEYEIPPLEKLAYDDWKDMAGILTGNRGDTKMILDSYKEFFLRICPDLEKEEIGDNQWLQFGSAYLESMGE